MLFVHVGNVFSDHTDGRLVQSDEISYFLQRVLMDSNDLVDLLVS